MIVADKRVLETSLSQGLIQIQQTLVNQYTQNLNTISFVAVLIAGIELSGIEQASFPSVNVTNIAALYVFYAITAVSLCISLYVLALSCIYSIWGPVMAMNGEDANTVIEATRIMRSTQYQMFLLLNLSYMMLFGASALWHWCIVYDGVASIVTFLFFVGIIIVVVKGFRTVQLFDPHISIRSMIFPQEEHKLADEKEIAEREAAISEVKVYT